VPKDARTAFGCTAVWKSLDTSNETEAQRLEKEHDVEFERRLREARTARDCVFRAKSATDSGMKSATDSDLISAIPI
jgi:hypothetical protein